MKYRKKPVVEPQECWLCRWFHGTTQELTCSGHCECRDSDHYQHVLMSDGLWEEKKG